MIEAEKIFYSETGFVIHCDNDDIIKSFNFKNIDTMELEVETTERVIFRFNIGIARYEFNVWEIEPYNSAKSILTKFSEYGEK